MLPEMLHRESLEFLELADGRAIVQRHLRRQSPGRTIELVWINQAGEILRQQEVRLLSGASFPDPEHNSWAMAVLLPEPIAVGLATSVAMPLDKLSSGDAESYSQALSQSLAQVWPALLCVAVIGAACAWFCLHRQRQYVAAPDAALDDVRLPGRAAGAAGVSRAWRLGAASAV